MAHYGKYHRIGTGREPTPWCYVFLLSHIHRLSDCTGNADSIAESDFTRIFIHDFVIAFLK